MRSYKPFIIIAVTIFLGISVYLFLGPTNNDTKLISNSTSQSPSSTLPSSNTTSDSLLAAFSLVILILLSLSIFTNLLLFKWRRQTINDQISIVPSELMAILEQLADKFVQMNKQLINNLNQSNKDNQTTKQLFSDLMETFTVLQSNLDDREKEIKRLKKGYDFQIFNKFLNRFIRIDYALTEEIRFALSENGNTLNSFQDIQNLLRDALQECGVSVFSPEIGESIRDAFGISDNYLTIPAKTKEREFTIAEVIEPGFKLQTHQGEDEICIRPAKVKIFIPKKDE
jgi:hypothetical protein